MTVVAQKTEKKINELHFEHQLWMSETKFWEDELKIFQNMLDEVAGKNNATDVRKQMDHFQNQFIIQKEQIDIINHLSNEHEQWLAKYAKDHPIAIDHVDFADHANLRDKVETFRKLYLELKPEFLRFIGTWM